MAKPTVSIYVSKAERELFLERKETLVEKLNGLQNVTGEWSVSRILRAAIAGEIVDGEDGKYLRFKVANK
jgi:hypothetical protein